MTDREDIVPVGLEHEYTDYGFSPVVRTGNILHLSGVVGIREDGSVDDNPTAQFAQAFASLAQVLQSAGCSLSDVVDMTTFHVGLREHLPAFIAAKRRAMAGPPHPAWTAVGVVELAIPGALVEIRTTALLPS